MFWERSNYMQRRGARALLCVNGGWLLGGTLDGLLDHLVQEFAHAAEPGVRGQEVDRAGVSGFSRRQGDGRGGGLDTLVLLILGVDTETDKLGASEIADIQLRVLEVEFHILGEFEGDDGVSFLDLVRVDDVRITAGEGRVKTNVRAHAGERKGDRVMVLSEGDAGDGMVLHHAAHMALVHEKSSDP